MPARIVLLVTSPRLPAGLLTAAAWDLVRGHPVLAAAEAPLVAAVRAAGAAVTVPGAPGDDGTAGGGDAGAAGAVDPVAALLAAAAAGGTVVWLAGPDGDGELARRLGLRLAREPALAELELVYGSWDPPGARLLDAVAVLDRLVSPGGDPWKRQQTHASLARYLLEECYEAYDAIEAGDLDALREELGDLLLQVVLHARMAQDLPEGERWSVDDVAADLVAKMIRRNPHVFAGASVSDVDEITENWEQIKRAEKSRVSALDGIARAQPALSLAAKILSRAERAGLAGAVPPPVVPVAPGDAGALGRALLGLVAAAQDAGVDAEAALRRAALAHAEALRAAERRQGLG
jgi:XTP/dITP diphosphohydrolase